jgi:3-isopropylmalate/(R)-2-methylmalate dehydratase large subunit
MTTCSPPLLERLFSTKVGRPVTAGEVIEVDVDLVMAHDATLALLIDDFTRLGRRIWDPSRVLITCDHFCPPARSDWAELQKGVLTFAQAAGIRDVRLYQGICHQLLLEDPRVRPGSILVGADSHTTLSGAVGGFATGLGATDILAVLATGHTWFKVPATRPIVLTGRRKPWVMGRDIALWLLGHFGEAGATYQALEIHDHSDDGVPMDGRAALCCMAPEMGAKAALVVPDGITAAYLRSREGQGNILQPPAELAPAQMPVPAEALTVALDDLDSLVACPHSPANVRPVTEAAGVPLNQIYLGSCAGGRLEDFAIAAHLLAGRHVAAGVKVIAVPSSVRVMQRAIEFGYLQTLLAAGVCVSNPSCGACGGIDKGVLAPGDIALMTSTRNFQGRLGPRDSAVYLASSATCAASALTGRLTDPVAIWE